MTFQDLPEDWDDRPLTAELLPDVVDLVVSVKERVRGCLLFLLLSPERRILQPVLVEEIPLHSGPTGSEEFLDMLAGLVRDEGGSVVFVRGRRGDEAPTADDRAWLDAVSKAFGDSLLAGFIATPAVVREAPGRADAA